MSPAVHLPIFLALCCYFVQFIAFTLDINPSNATNDDDPQILCKTTDIWTRPSWPTNIWQHCSELLGNLEDIQPEIYADDPPLHEFLAVGVTPTDHDLVPVRTPWKMTNGPCTLAVTTLNSTPTGWLPRELSPPPFDPSGYSSWFSIWDDAKTVLDVCVQEQKAGMSWIEDRPAIGVFLYSTGSQIDRAIGLKVNSALVLPSGVSVTDSNSTVVDEAVS